MADNIASNALKLYLNGDIDLDALEERIVPLAWVPEFEDHELVGIILTEIAYINDGVSDETIFRARLAEAGAPMRAAAGI